MQTDKIDFSPLLKEIATIVNPIVTFIFGLIGLVSVFFIIKIGWKLMKGKVDDRKEALTQLMWWAVGLIIAITSVTLVNLFLPIVSANRINPELGDVGKT